MRIHFTAIFFVLVIASSFSWGAIPTKSRSCSAGKVIDSRLAVSAQTSKRKRRPRKPDVIYYPTPPETVAEMLRLANVKKGDVLYDLGSGDGRIPIAAAKQFGIRAIGIEIDPKLITEAESNARAAGVGQLVIFRNEDMFRVDIREASIVTLYLSDKLNVLLRPKLLHDLRPGSRIISHDFRMGDWKPEQTVRVPWGKLYRTVYLWTVPRRSKTRSLTFHRLVSRRSKGSVTDLVGNGSSDGLLLVKQQPARDFSAPTSNVIRTRTENLRRSPIPHFPLEIATPIGFPRAVELSMAPHELSGKSKGRREVY